MLNRPVRRSTIFEKVDDDAAFERVVNTPPRGIGAATIELVREHARAHSISLWTAAQQLADTLAARARNALHTFFDLLNQLQRDSEALELADLVDQMLTLPEAAGPGPHAARADGSRAADRGHRPADRRAGL